MNRLLQSPTCWFLIQGCLLLVWLAASGRFQPQTVPDTQSYLDLPLTDLKASLSGIRTLGYPVFLAGVEVFGSESRFVPLAQVLVHLAAAGFFAFALIRFGLPRGHAVAAAAAVAWSKATFDWMAIVNSDALGMSLAVMAIAACLLYLSQQPDWRALSVVALTVALAYHVRPVYLYLIPLIPALGWLFRFTRLAPTVDGVNWTARSLIELAAAVVVPYLLYCLLRLIVVGHFGLVSFGGCNSIGITGQLIDPTLAHELPADKLQPLALEMIRRRSEMPDWEPPQDFAAMERMYNVTVWQLAVPSARDLYGDDPVVTNGLLSDLSKAIMAQRFGSYVRWLRWGGREGVLSIIFLSTINKPVLFCVGMMIVLLAWQLFRQRCGYAHVTISDTQRRQALLAVQTLLWVAIGFAAAKLMLVVLVEIPMHRYLAPASVFFPALIAVLCLNACQRLGILVRRDAEPT